MRIWGFPKIKGTFLGVPIIRNIVYWGLYWGSPILGNYHMGDSQNYGPLLGPYYSTAPNIQGTQKGTIILITTHMFLSTFSLPPPLALSLSLSLSFSLLSVRFLLVADSKLEQVLHCRVDSNAKRKLHITKNIDE